MHWRILVFRIRRHQSLLARTALALVAVALIAAVVVDVDHHRQYTLTVNIQPPFVGEGVQIYTGCCRIVNQLSGDRQTFVFVLQRGDYNVGGLLAQNGEFRPLPTPLFPVHLDHDQAITLHGGG